MVGILTGTPYVTKGTHPHIYTRGTGESGTCTFHILSYIYTVLTYIEL